nr:anti-sigma factor antagonist [Anaerolineae bacterium]
MAQTRQLVVSGYYSNIPLITNFIAEAAEAAGFGEAQTYHCQMAVDEACTNVIEHAYGGEGIGDITVICQIEPDRFVIQVLDSGDPFDPEAVPVPLVADDLDAVTPGGIGLHLMRQMMDDVRFEFSDAGNQLTMVKHILSDSPEPSEPYYPVEWLDADLAVIRPQGRIDSANAQLFEETLLSTLDDREISLVVDMEKVTYISSRGLKSLIAAWRIVRSQNRDVVLGSLNDTVLEVLDTMGFTRVFTIFDSLEEAVNYSTSASKRLDSQ